jgi:hypothetical protein
MTKTISQKEIETSRYLTNKATTDMQFMQRFPNVELSYEIVPHKKVSPDYNACVAIPNGKKSFVWFTYNETDDICVFIDIGRDKKIIETIVYDPCMPIDLIQLAKGTLLYGTVLDTGAFIVEDIFLYAGLLIKSLPFGQKLGYICQFVDCVRPVYGGKFQMPYIWSYTPPSVSGPQNVVPEYDPPYEIPETIVPAYVIHHIQYRCLRVVGPYYNIYPQKKGFNKNTTSTAELSRTLVDPNLRKRCAHISDARPQYKLPTTFMVCADLQFDVYHLYAYGKGRAPVYYDVAYIPTYRLSVFMNKIFRRIRENDDLDAIEASDDEADFENVAIDKYVDLQKMVSMECKYDAKFRQWIPQKVVSNKVVHISALVRESPAHHPR